MKLCIQNEDTLFLKVYNCGRAYDAERLTSCFSTDARVLVHLKSEDSLTSLVKHQNASTSSSKMANNGAKRSVIPKVMRRSFIAMIGHYMISPLMTSTSFHEISRNTLKSTCRNLVVVLFKDPPPLPLPPHE